MIRHPWLPRSHRRLRAQLERPGRFRIAVPRELNEKYAWRKLFDRNPLFSTVNDKLACKAWVRDLGIDAPMAPVLWVGTDARDIPAELFDRPIAIKANLRSKLNVFHDGTQGQREASVAAANACLEQAGGSPGLWDYFEINPRLFVEERLFTDREFCDLNIIVCGPDLVQINTTWTGPGEKLERWFPDQDGEFHCTEGDTPDDRDSVGRPLPATIGQAMTIARDIGKRFDNIRVDFLATDTELFLGEITFNSRDGRNRVGFDTDLPGNRMWDLRRSWFMATPQKGWRELYRRALWRELDRQEKQSGTARR